MGIGSFETKGRVFLDDALIWLTIFAYLHVFLYLTSITNNYNLVLIIKINNYNIYTSIINSTNA